MKVLLINTVCGTGSTGRICVEIADKLEKEGHVVMIAYGRGSPVPERMKKNAIRIGSDTGVRINALKARLSDSEGLNAKRATKAFLKRADSFDPDLVWLHNLHGYYLNYELLFGWLKSRPKTAIRWTLHDCWAFTGHCAYFSYAGCDNWLEGCRDCPQKRSYPKSIVDRSARNYQRKKAAFTGVGNMTIVSPSEWLSDLAGRSFLKDYPREVVRNGINTDVFRPRRSDFRERFGLTDKKIVLGVAGVWDRRKGLSDFIKLSGMLDERYKIVLVGLSEKQIKTLPPNVLGLKKTDSAEKLAEIYSAADVFLNLTYEDNYPTVNLEAQSCGTACLTYRTGGSVESVPESNVVGQGNLDAVVAKIKEITCDPSAKTGGRSDGAK